MATTARRVAPIPPPRGYRDLREHLDALKEAGLLRTIDAPVNKDTELHPLVRWQFRGGIAEAERTAFLFTHVVDGKGRRYDMPVVVGALATNPAIYGIGMRAEVADIGATWTRAIASPIPPVVVEDAACQQVVWTGADLDGEGRGLDALPVPVSTPGFDAAPFLTATCCISRDPDTGVQNMGTYRCQIKGSRKLGLKMFLNIRAGGYEHWRKYKAKGEPMPMAIVVGCPPPVAYLGPQKLPHGIDEITVAGGIAGEPIHVVRAKTVDLNVPAESEIVIEGLVDTAILEPEGPFGESHGHVNLEEYNFVVDVTAITMKSDAVLCSIISQVTPSESSVIKRVAYEPRFLAHLRDHLGVKGVTRVAMHEPLTNLRKLMIVQFEAGVPRTEVWRALYGAASYDPICGKYVIAVNQDIDPDNADAVFWAMAYRADPGRDSQLLHHRPPGHGPKHGNDEESALLIDATLKAASAPVALPTRPYMENARALWEKLGLPALRPESPWHGYQLGDWSEKWDQDAARAAAGDYQENARRAAQDRRGDVAPNTYISAAPKRT
ncbi:MAG: UbiD family decarboxylase [Rhodospirillaceae bacterium]